MWTVAWMIEAVAWAGDIASLRTACAEGAAERCAELGSMILSDQNGDATEAVAAHARACDLGLKPSCTTYALLLAEGRGVDANPPRAQSLLEPLCGDEVWAACRGLGMLLNDGKPPRDEPEKGAGSAPWPTSSTALSTTG